MTSDKEYMRQYMAKRYVRRKEAAIEQLGGVCNECGSEDDLQFDHINPETKSFTICKELDSVAEDRLQEELKKCQLLCVVCHREKTHENKDYAFNQKEVTCCGRTFVGRQYSGHRRWCHNEPS